MIVICVLACLALVFAGLVFAQIPKKINYQGLLTDSATGEPIVGSVSLTFKLYDDSTNGALLWTESQVATADTNGVISVILGTTEAIDIAFEGQAYLQIEVDGETLTPRRELVSVPYAFNAMAAGDADSLGGLHSDSYPTEGELSDPGTLNDAGNPVDWTRLKGVPAGFADEVDDVGGAGDGRSLDAADGATAAAGSELVIEDDGNTRISMLSPNNMIAGVDFGDPEDSGAGYLLYSHLNNKLRFGVSSVDKMVIDSAGDVGIGTGSPGTKLHVYDDTNSQVNLRIENPNTGSSSSDRISFTDENGDLAFIATYDEGNGTYPDAMVIANNRPDGIIRMFTDASERLKIANFGNTTLTSSGGSPLQCNTSGGGYIEIITATDSPTGLYMQNNRRRWFLLHSPGGTNDRIAFYDGGPSPSGPSVGERLIIEGGTGNVGIGTTGPSGRFHIWTGTDDPSPADPHEALYVQHAHLTADRVVNLERTQNALAMSDMLQILMPVGSADDCQFIECERGADKEFRVEGNGDVYADGTFNPGGADLSEMVAVTSGAASAEPGDVMVIDPMSARSIVKASSQRSTLVAGIYSTAPGFICSERGWDITEQPTDSGDQPRALDLMASEFSEIPLAVVGIVPCKASAENGPIRPGDLLVTSSTPGHAMRDDNPAVGTVVGKSLGSLGAGTGTIKVLVTLQ